MVYNAGMPIPVTTVVCVLIFGAACAVSFGLSWPVMQWADSERSDFAATVCMLWMVGVFALCMWAGFRVLFRYAKWETEFERNHRTTSEGRNQNS